MKFDKKTDGTPSSGGDKFIKLKSGDSITGIFRGEVHSYFIKWDNGKSVQVSSDEPGAKIRFELNFVTMIDGKFVAKIFGFPQSVYNQLAEINDEYDLSTIKVKISRRGEKLETIYSILPLLKEPIPPHVMKQIDAVPLHILDATKPQAPKDDAPWPDEASELPF